MSVTLPAVLSQTHRRNAPVVGTWCISSIVNAYSGTIAEMSLMRGEAAVQPIPNHSAGLLTDGTLN